MKKFKWLKVVAFILALCIPLLCLAEWYSFPTSYVTRIIESFYDEKEDTVDGVVIGTSVIGMGWMAPIGWHEYGMTVCNLGTTVQPFGAIPEIIEFAKSRQNIKYVVIDIHGIRRSAIISSVLDKNLRRLYLSMHLSSERYKMLNISLEFAQRVYDYYGYPKNESDIITNNKLQLYVPFYDFHNRWKDGLVKADYTQVINPYKGAYDTNNTFKIFDASDLVSKWNCTKYGLDSFQINELEMLFDYLEDTDMPVLFINYPSVRGEEEESQLLAAAKYIEEKGYNVLNMCDMNVLNEIGFDVSADFINNGHVNSKGAYKVVKYVCSFLKENYEYEDHRGQEGYESWDKATEDYDKFLRAGWLDKTGEEFTFMSK